MELVEITNPVEDDPIWAVLKDTADKSPMKFKVGAVILRKGKIIGKGFNTKKTHPLGAKENYKTMHAEIAALYDCIKKRISVRGCIVYVFRRNNETAKPCNCCFSTLKFFGVSKVFYTFNPNSRCDNPTYKYYGKKRIKINWKYLRKIESN